MPPTTLKFVTTTPAPSTLNRILSLLTLFSKSGSLRPSLSPQTSTGSKKAKSINSIPLFWNFAIFASVPASTITFVITLCACRLYKGIMARRVEDVLLEAKEAKDVVDELLKDEDD